MKKEYMTPVSTEVRISLTLLNTTSPGRPQAAVEPEETVEAEAIESRMTYSVWDDEEE